MSFPIFLFKGPMDGYYGSALHALFRGHTLLTHFPIVLVILVYLIELRALLTGRFRSISPDHEKRVGWPLGGALVTSVLAALLGWGLASVENYQDKNLILHRNLGLITTVMIVFSALFQKIKRKVAPFPSRPFYFFYFLYFFSLSGTMVLVILTAHYGGVLHYGENYFLWAGQTDLSAGDSLYHQKIRPLFVRKCLSCHNPENSEGGLDLSHAEGILAGGNFGPVLIPGEKHSSELYKRLLLPVEDIKHMPKGKGALSQEDIRAVGQWIDKGAVLPQTIAETAVPVKHSDHWAFEDFPCPPVPDVKDRSWPKNGIDFFILSELEKRHLKPAADLPPGKLARRIFFDMTGLPPAPEEGKDGHGVDIDQLLSSPHYGEKWGRHWLDLVRYGDTSGYEKNTPLEWAYQYRDFVIRSLNKDIPYDRFLTMQLAGDLFFPGEVEAALATQFYFIGPVNLGFRPDDKTNLYLKYDDWMSTFYGVTVGLDMKCARCHNHKFNPISLAQYYQQLIPFMEIEEKVHPDLQKLTRDLEINAGKPVTAEYFEAFRGLPGKAPLVEAENGKRLLKNNILLRGNPQKSGGKVAFAPLGIYQGKNPSFLFWKEKFPVSFRGKGLARKILTRWATDPVDGVGKQTARVMVDHLWRNHFGRGLMSTPANWGPPSPRPLHLGLLNWLSHQLIQNHWSLKSIHKLILESRTYRLDSRLAGEEPPRDLDWDLFRVRTPRKLEAELIRDAILAVSGTLNGKMYGPAVKLSLDKGRRDLLREKYSEENPSIPVDGKNRRSLYLHINRNVPHPFLGTLGLADPHISVPQRRSQVDFQEAFLFMNDPFILEQSTSFAERINREAAGSTLDKKIDRMFDLALHRPPAPEEKEWFRSMSDGPRLTMDMGRVMFGLNEFIYID